MKSIEFKDIKIMEKYYPNLEILKDYKKSFSVYPLNRKSKGLITEEGICPTCGEEVFNNPPYESYCSSCLQNIKWD